MGYSHKIDDISCRLLDIVHEQLECDDVSAIDAEELGEVIDMIKDLAEAKEKVHKAEYYQSVVDAMASSKVEGASGDHHEEMLMEHPDDFTMKSVAMLRKAWAHATPETRRHMKSEITKLSTEMVM